MDDGFTIFKMVWAILGPFFGTKDAPAAFWSHLKEQGAELWALLEPIWEGQVDDGMAYEDGCRRAGVMFAGLFFTLGVWRRDSKSVPLACPHCKAATKWRWTDRTLKTTCGIVPIWRREVRCTRCHQLGRTVTVDRALGFEKGDKVSPRLRYWSLRLGAALPYPGAEKYLTDWTGQAVLTAQGIHDLCQEAGRAMPECPVVTPATTPGQLPERIIVDADAAVLPLHHTAKGTGASTPGDIDPTSPRKSFELWVGRTYERMDTLYGGKSKVYRHLAFAGGCMRAGDDVPLIFFGLVNRRFPNAIPERTVYVRGDGGATVDAIAKLFPNSRRLLDQYHTLVKVSKRLKEGFKEASKRWRRGKDDLLSGLLREGAAADLVTECVDLAKAHPTAADAMLALAKHVNRHKDHIWYPEAKELGIGVGTGIAEKDVDLVLDRRFELRGMSWSPEGARNALRLRISIFNNDLASLERVCSPAQADRRT